MSASWSIEGTQESPASKNTTLRPGNLSKTPAKKTYEPTKLLSLDIDDHIDPSTREWITVDEEGNMQFPAVSEQRAQELGARFEAWRSLQTLTAEQDRWLRILGEQVRANADDITELFPDHFAYFHTFSSMGGLREAQRVFGGDDVIQALLDSLNIALFTEPLPRDDGAGDTPQAAAH